MTPNDVERALRECKRFLTVAGRFMATYRSDPPDSDIITGTAESGAVRRASLDLWRELARMRGERKPL